MVDFAKLHPHAFGCICAACARKATEAYNETKRIAEHNRSYYATGHRVTLPPASAAFDRHHSFEWQRGAPYPGELEYLR